MDEQPLKISDVNELLGLNLWEATSFKAVVYIDFDEYGNIIKTELGNSRFSERTRQPSKEAQVLRFKEVRDVVLGHKEGEDGTQTTSRDSPPGAS